jgi:C1A family cysteine protease
LQTFQLGHNKYSHHELKEFSRLFKGFDATHHSRKHDSTNFSLHTSLAKLPEAVDWRQKGYVNNVVDQGQCGCCYAFAACAAIEAQYFKAHGKLIKLSGIFKIFNYN